MAYIVFYDTTDSDRDQLSESFKGTDHHIEFIAEPLTASVVRQDAEMISLFVNSSLDKSLIDMFPRLKVIACRSTGFNNVDVAYAESKDIAVVNVPTYGEETVAEFSFALLLALSRKLLPTITASRDRHVKVDQLMGFDLAQKTLGLLGAGRIGQKVAKIARGFDMNVIAYDPYPNHEAAEKLGFSYATFDEVIAKSDVLSVHTPYTHSNHHFLNKEVFSRCKPGVVLVNTARGELVNTRDLIEALQTGIIGAAGLDVIENEKLLLHKEEEILLRADHLAGVLSQQNLEIEVLERMPNVIITPHNAFNTKEAIKRINDTTAHNLIRYWYGEIPNKVAAPVKPMGKLIIARHAESEWNAIGVWTGSRDVHLSEKGFHESTVFGRTISDIPVDFAFTSQQIRAFETMEGMLNSTQQFDVPYIRSAALNERNYGDYTGLNKWQVEKDLGNEVFEKLRRSWDFPVPNGETLKDVYSRSVPFYTKEIVKKLHEGLNVLIVAHGNSIRSLVKYIENLTDEEIEHVEMLYGSLLIYTVNEQGKMLTKEVRQAGVVAPHM